MHCVGLRSYLAHVSVEYAWRGCDIYQLFFRIHISECK